jgi:uncharacterized C2H2 Zn-finger protein
MSKRAVRVNQGCPSCGKKQRHNEGYPNHLCSECAAKVTDKKGRPIGFSNVEKVTTSRKKVTIHVGGAHGYYQDSGAPYRGTDCYAGGLRCRVEEAHFGGIVIKPESRK